MQALSQFGMRSKESQVATREIYWNVDGVWVMYLLFAVVAAVFAAGIYRNWLLIRLGKTVGGPDRVGDRVRQVGLHAVLQLRGLRDHYSGAMHLMIFWGFVALFLGTLVVFLQADLGIPIMHGQFYLYFQSLTLDILGLLAIVGVLMAALKRFVLRARRLVEPPRLRNWWGDGLILGWILLILVTGFILEGMRIAATQDPWGNWSPVGKAVGAVLLNLGFEAPGLRFLHRSIWWFHLLISFGLIAYLPFSKLRHILFSPLAIYSQSLEPRGALRGIDMEAAETLGTSGFGDFPRKRLLDLRACTECGRCQDACPAYATGQPLTPKAVILDLRNRASSEKRVARSENGKGMPAIDAATPEALWSCVTCGSCMEQCPVFIEHVPAIVDMRRYLVMEKAEYPGLMQEALTCLEARGHPYRGTRFSRTDWCEGLDVRVVSDSGPAEWLYWVGCTAAFEERNQRVARAFATVLKRAGVDFAILGEEEICTGDVARRIGNEYLFQMLAQQNVETLNRYGVKKIVTTCAHCLNALKNEYPAFGGDFEVLHHTELMDRLLREGRLHPTEPVPESLTYHDPCYLARYNGVTEPPRAILGSLKGLRLSEVRKNRKSTFCCGGGGGHMWFEETGARRINHERADQLLAVGTSAIATACPFCMVMVTDGVNARKGDREAKVLDIAEMVEQATRATKRAASSE